MSDYEYKDIDTGKPRDPERKPPGFFIETTFAVAMLFFLKMHSDDAFGAFSFMMVLLPYLVYFVASIIMDIIKFIQQLHLEEIDPEEGFLTPKQIRILVRVMRDLLFYFAIYNMAGLLDKHVI